MATFIREQDDSQEKIAYTVSPTDKKVLARNLSMLNPDDPNARRIRSILKKYNERSKGKKTAGKKPGQITIGDEKRMNFDIRQQHQNAPDEFSSHVLDIIAEPAHQGAQRERARNSNKVNAVKPPSKPSVKAPKTPNTEVKPVKPNSVNESRDNSDHPYYEYIFEYNPRRILEMYKDGDTCYEGLINPDSYKQALSEFMKYGQLVRFPKNKIFQWFGTIMRNTAILRSVNALSGRDVYFPTDEFLDVFFYDEKTGGINYDAWDEYKENIGVGDDYRAADTYLEELDPSFYDWAVMPDGSVCCTDYGLEPLEKVISEYDEDKTAEEVLVLLNKALDVTHWQGDLSSIFIVGGKKSLSRISEEIKKPNKQLNEKKYYINTDIENDKNYIYPVKISVDEFEKKLSDIYSKYYSDGKPSAKTFIHKFCSYENEANRCKELKKLAKDLKTVKADGENCDMIGKIRTVKKGIPYAIVRKGGDWEIPVLFMVYYDGENIRAYFPKKGNSINLDKMRALDPLSGSENDDLKYVKKFYPNEKDIQKILDSVYYDENLCIKDFEDHIKTNKKRKITESANIDKKTVIITEEQLNKIKKVLLAEDKISKNMHQARTFIRNSDINEDPQIYIEKVRNFLPNSRLNDCQFLLGCVRVFPELWSGAANRNWFNKALELINRDYFDDFDSNLNNLSATEIIEKLKDEILDELRSNSLKVNSHEYHKNHRYKIVPILTYEEAEKYSSLTEWCVCDEEDQFDIYGNDGTTLYFCLRDDYLTVKQEEGENFPWDDYGLSMIAVSVHNYDSDWYDAGGAEAITSRWNAFNEDPDDYNNVLGEEELSQILGVNFYEVFKPIEKTQEKDI